MPMIAQSDYSSEAVRSRMTNVRPVWGMHYNHLQVLSYLFGRYGLLDVGSNTNSDDFIGAADPILRLREHG